MRETEGESASLSAQSTPSLDLVFDVLSNRRRRYVLYHLHDQPDGVATTDELIDAVMSLEDAATGPDAVDVCGDAEERRRRINTELQHNHLPKLEDAGLLEHDQRSETVRYWTQPSLAEWLEHACHKEQLSDHVTG